MAPWPAGFQAFSMAFGVGGFSEYVMDISCRHSAALECLRRDAKGIIADPKDGFMRCGRL